VPYKYFTNEKQMILHIETTNRCILECPACPRTTWKNLVKRPVEKTDLDVDLLEKFLDCDQGKKIKSFLLAGDYGDCIYYPDIFKLIERFRDRVSFHLVTNGSRRDEKFWTQLSSMLTSTDSITFSIDGLEETNHLYRINSDWHSIITGVSIMAKGPAKVHWKTIVFKFNYDNLTEIKHLAESMGASWHAEKTHRYEDINLIPPSEFVENNYVFQETFCKNDPIVIEPQCEKNAKIITADGYLFPCDWMRNPRTLYKSQLWKQKTQWIDRVNIRNTNYDRALEVIREWEKQVIENGINGSSNLDVLCKMKCRQGCVADNKINFV
jgi:MoaA/NifB/PqqE/SkfB family radical SAM enzyme